MRLFRLLLFVLAGGILGGCVAEGEPGADSGASAAVATRPEADPATADDRRAWSARPDGPSLFEHVAELARRRADAPYNAPRAVVSRDIANLTYAQYRGISFRAERSLWRDGSRFEAQLFHPGGGNVTPVRLHLVEEGTSHSLSFDPAFFSYGDELADVDTELPPEAGYAGFRVHYPLNDPTRMDEVVSFLGASYFRVLGPGHAYGLSSRGIAVDVGRPDAEEFPAFVEFWLERPDPDQTTLTVFGLLDGPSITGAYRFGIDPGEPASREPTMIDVEARLFARTDVGRLGVAPLTSMYLHGPLEQGRFEDFRPRVHDSDGLLVHTGRGEWIWRPLTNRAEVRQTSLRDVSPAGFGLAQRHREFSGYMDLEAQYDRRPSEWVAIEDDWGAGGVELFEAPTESEFNDNVVASWVSDEPFRAGDERTYRYRLVTFDARLADHDVVVDSVADPVGASTAGSHERIEGQTLAQVVRTRIGRDALPGTPDPTPRNRRRVVIDFAGGPLDTLGTADVTAHAETSAGRITDLLVHVLPDGGRRATFALSPDGDNGADMRVQLLVGDAPVSETWSYLWEPRRGS